MQKRSFLHVKKRTLLAVAGCVHCRILYRAWLRPRIGRHPVLDHVPDVPQNTGSLLEKDRRREPFTSSDSRFHYEAVL